MNIPRPNPKRGDTYTISERLKEARRNRGYSQHLIAVQTASDLETIGFAPGVLHHTDMSNLERLSDREMRTLDLELLGALLAPALDLDVTQWEEITGITVCEEGVEIYEDRTRTLRTLASNRSKATLILEELDDLRRFRREVTSTVQDVQFMHQRSKGERPMFTLEEVVTKGWDRLESLLSPTKTFTAGD